MGEIDKDKSIVETIEFKVDVYIPKDLKLDYPSTANTVGIREQQPDDDDVDIKWYLTS